MKRFSLLFILVFAVAAFGQEAMEAPAEEMATDMVADSAAVDTMAMDDMIMEEAPMEEAVVEEDAGDALEAMLAEEGTMETEVTSGSAMIGYTAGLMVGYPVGLGALEDNEVSPVFGVVGTTPFGFAVGPIEMGLGFEVGYYDLGNETAGPALLATVNSAVVETAQGAVAIELGAGWYGRGPGGVAGASFSYAVPNMPIVIKPYTRANVVMDLELAKSDDDDGIKMWINFGLIASYDLGDLF